MDAVREVCSATSALRKAGNLRNRLPLSTLTSSSPTRRRSRASRRSSATRSTSRRSGCCRSTPTRPRRTASSSGSASTRGPPDRGWARTCRPRSRPRSRATGRWPRNGSVTAGGLALVEGSTSSRRWPAPPPAVRRPACCAGAEFVVLDTEVTPELAAEGLARDLVRQVQQLRRERARGQRPDRAHHRRLAGGGGGSQRAPGADRRQGTLATAYDVVAAETSEPTIKS